MKILWFFIVLCIIAIPIAVQADITSNLVGHWKLNDGSGTTPQDSSGNGYHGTFVSAPTWTAGHIGSGALDCNGSSDGVDLTNGANLTPSTAVSLAVWVNTDAATTTQSMFVKNQTDAGMQYGLQWRSTQRIRLQVTAGGSGASSDSNTNLNATTWYHLLGVYNGTDLRTYVNGSLDNTPAAKTGTMTDNGQTVLLCKDRNTGTTYFNGRVDDARIYARALTSTDATELHAFTETAVTKRRPLWFSQRWTGTWLAWLLPAWRGTYALGW